jgi:hypothetical protein
MRITGALLAALAICACPVGQLYAQDEESGGEDAVCAYPDDCSGQATWPHKSPTGTNYIWTGKHTDCRKCMQGDTEVEPQNCHGGWGCDDDPHHLAFFGLIMNAATRGDVDALLGMAPFALGRISINLARQSLQVNSCDGQVIANLSLQVPALTGASFGNSQSWTFSPSWLSLKSFAWVQVSALVPWIAA